ncbi:Cysteine desulfurase SufS [anaerobic digester metagenome]
MNWKDDFPIFQTPYYGQTLTYLDSGATAQKPRQVIAAVTDYLETTYANPHRGAYRLSQEATARFEGVREKVRAFLGARSISEIIFVKNSTEALNLVARSYAEATLQPGDEIVISIAEHHANLVPWQRAAQRTGARLVYLYIDEDGSLPEAELAKISQRTKMVAVTHVSNVTGHINDVAALARAAHAVGAVILVDGSQAVPHLAVDVRELDVDFYTFTGHKIMSLTGAGVLYGRESVLEGMEPFLLGGDMIEYVEEQRTTYNTLPYKFEAGTPLSEAVISLGAAIDYLKEVGYDRIGAIDADLTQYLLAQLAQIPQVRVIGGSSPKNRAGIVTFTLDGVHAHDVAHILDSKGICVRAGHHCAQPLARYCNTTATTRVSFWFYNTREDCDRLVRELKRIRRLMGLGTE